MNNRDCGTGEGIYWQRGNKTAKSSESTEKVGCVKNESFFSNLDLHIALDNIPENRPLYKDSGLWQVRSDDMEEVLFQQTCDESFTQFIRRVCKHSHTFDY